MFFQILASHSHPHSMQHMAIGSSGISGISPRSSTGQHSSPQGGATDRWSQMEGAAVDYQAPLSSEPITGTIPLAVTLHAEPY